MGVRTGESTRVFLEVAKKFNSKIYSVDLSEKPNIEGFDNWHFHQGDDLSFGKELTENNRFPDGRPFSGIDLLFIDTSHEFEHTLKELEIFFPLMSDKGLVVLHDTNLSEHPNRRLDGSVNVGWDNTRGVTRALESFFKTNIKEDLFQSYFNPGKTFAYLNIPWCNGLYFIKRCNP